MSDQTGWMTPEEAKEKRQTDIGPPKYDQFLPPVIKNNYGKWKYHEVMDGGTMVTRSSSKVTRPTRSRCCRDK